MSKRKSTLRDLERAIERTSNQPPAQALGSLRRIAQELKTPARPRTIAQAQSFDHGMPITTHRTAPRVQAQTYTTALSGLASWATATEGVGAYQVEAFEAPRPAPQVVAATYEAPVSFAMPAAPVTAPRRPLADALNIQEIEAELAAIREQSGSPVQPAEPPLMMAAAQAAPPPALNAEPPPAPSTPHDIFDRMGKSMRYANTFDLGAIDLGRRFDEFDREMSREETVARAATAAPADHLEEDLRTIRALSRMRNTVSEPVITPAGTVAPAPPAPPPEPIVRHDVPLIAEQKGLSADAAAACMLLAWKHGLEPNAAAVINGQGGWSAYQDAIKQAGLALLSACGLETVGPELPNSDLIRGLLERFGPVWIGAPDANIRGRVITGLSIEPTAQQALLHIADARDERSPDASATPHAVDYTMPFMQFVRTLPESSAGWIIAHLPATAKP